MKFSTVWDMEYNMKSNGLYCGLNSPEALVSKKDGEEEFKHRLPPYAKRKFYLADEYPACPTNWMRSEGKLTSYFVPVQEGKGMWLDFNANWNNKHHVAIVISVQGVNPITGLPCTDAHLEQYIEECPKCKKKFGPNRLCKTCGYVWPKQNYISTTGTNINQLWIDGFRTAEGVVRQYILTQEKMKGVASNIIGEDKVYAIGISFFLSKEAKPERTIVAGGGGNYNNYPLNSHQWFSPLHTPVNWQAVTPSSININEYDNSSYTTSISVSGNDRDLLSTGVLRSINRTKQPLKKTDNISHKCGKMKSLGKTKGWSDSKVTKSELQYLQRTNDELAKTPTDPNLLMVTSHAFEVDVEKVEIGAGANIDQIVADDPESLDFWKNEPESILVINYCLEEDCEKILNGGKVSLKGHKEGFLKEMAVGN